MNYAERLAACPRCRGESVRLAHPCGLCGVGISHAGHRPGEMNDGRFSLEPHALSAPGRCNRFAFDRSKGWDGSDPTPCKLPSNHEGAHEA